MNLNFKQLLALYVLLVFMWGGMIGKLGGNLLIAGIFFLVGAITGTILLERK